MSEHALHKLTQCTLAELIEVGGDYLAKSDLVYGHGTDNPHDESAWLALEACGLSPAEPLENYHIDVNRGHLERAKNWYRQRADQKIPVAYITGRSWFAGHEFVTDSRALIPRSPIAELICTEFEPWLTDTPDSILDLCCGGGCIAIACALQFPDATVHGTDLSPEALQLAALNREKHQLQDHLQFFEGDLFNGLPIEQRYDLIVSNPPYVDREDMQGLAAEFQHEPQMGLAAGIDGLDIVDKILGDAQNRLTDNGVLIVEVGNSQPAVEQRYPELELIWLEFEMGGAGVFLTTAASLKAA